MTTTKKTAKKRARRQGNPTDSKWYSTPQHERRRQQVGVTLPDDVREALLAHRERSGEPVSTIVEDALRAWLRVPKQPGD